MSKKPEAWLRGPLPDVAPVVQPIVFALMQVIEDLSEKIPALGSNELWQQPSGAASIGFHLKHLAGSTDRLITYALGLPLSDEQRRQLDAEKEDQSEEIDKLVARAEQVLGDAIQTIRETAEADLLIPRKVGRAGMPSTVIGLYSHAAEHAARHMGQIITTSKIVTGSSHAARRYES